MEGTQVILWSMGGGFTVTFGLLVFMWNAMSSRFDKVDARFDKLEEKVTDAVVEYSDKIKEKNLLSGVLSHFK